MIQKKDNKTIALIMLEGMGIQENYEGNALFLAKMPFLKSLINRFPATSLIASGERLGYENNLLPRCTINHEIIGVGNPYYSNNFLADSLINNKQFFRQKAFASLVKEAKEKNKFINIIVLCSTSNKHSNIDHLLKVLKYFKYHNLSKIYIHAILDGIDAPAQSGRKILNDLNIFLKDNQIGEVKTVCGRFYAMDRSRFLDRTKKYFDAICGNSQKTIENIDEYISKCYEKQINDDEIVPALIGKKNHQNDNIFLILNNRNDRFRQIFEMIVSKKIGSVYTFFSFGENIPHEVICKKQKTQNSLVNILRENQIKEYFISSPEKFSQINYFFNGEFDKGTDNNKIIIKNDKESIVAFKKFLKNDGSKFFVVNISKIDSQENFIDFKKTLFYLERFDKTIKTMVELILSSKGTAILSGDHGRVEEFLNPENNLIINKKNTNNPVPLVIVNKKFEGKKITGFDLASSHGFIGKSNRSIMDIAPTILRLYGIEKPKEMAGESLID